EGGVEVGVDGASALAGAAVVTGSAVALRPREDGDPSRRHRPAQAGLDTLAQPRLRAGQGHGREVPAVRKLLEPLGEAGDADVVLDEVVVRLEVLVPERPILADAVVEGGLEVGVAEPVALPAPHVRAAARHAQASQPREGLAGRGRVRLLEVVEEPLVVELVAPGAGLDGTRAAQQLRRPVALLQAKGRRVLAVLAPV